MTVCTVAYSMQCRRQCITLVYMQSKNHKCHLGESIRVSKQALSTDNELKLVRSGGDPERLSLTNPHQAALKRRVAEVRLRVAPDPDEEHGDAYTARDSDEWS